MFLGYFAAFQLLPFGQIEIDIEIVILLSEDGSAFIIVLYLVQQIADSFLSLPYPPKKT